MILLGHRALRGLVALKLKAGLRAQVRRLRRPSSWLFMAIGLVLVGFWVSSLVFSGMMRRRGVGDPQMQAALAGAAVSMLGLVTVVGAISHRGLYLPREEIELLFSAPVSRSDLVRYRLFVNLLRSLLTGLIFGLGAARNLPHAGCAFAGTMLTVMTIPILGQATAILLGDAENRFGRLAKRMPLQALTRLVAVLFLAGLGILLFTGDAFRERLGEALRPGELSLPELVRTPLVQALLLPVRPWVEMMTAPDWGAFLPWFGLCALLWVAAYELTARIPVDYRELSLATSADIARRLNRLRRGQLGAGGADIARESLGWRVPWAFGRGPFGAVAWLKLVAIARKARGTMMTSALILFALTIAFTVMFDEGGRSVAVGGALPIVGLGTLYLCLGLRFDFRGDLEIMQLVKTWPIAAWRTFLATVLPEVVLVSLLLWAAVLARAAWIGGWYPEVFLLLALQPLVTLVWVALDNLVFLYAPVRYTPGQEGALQHIGRSMLLMLLRMTLFGAVFLLIGLPGGLVYWLVTEILEGSVVAALAAVTGVALVGLSLSAAALVAGGGWMLRRFDVARDRG